MPPDAHDAGLSTDEFKQLLAVGETIELASGATLFHRGDASDALFAIEHGRIRLEFGEAKKRKVIGPGELFGELFLGRGSLRTADAIAEVSTQVTRIDRSKVDDLKRSQPRLLCSLLEGTCATLLASEAELVTDLRQRNNDLEQAFDYLLRTRRELDRESLLARTDETTGLYNKRCLEEQFDDFVKRAESTGWSLALMWLDLDDFKQANDHGYEMGDAVLKFVGSFLRGVIRSTDLPCRWGGDEFCVLTPAVGHGSAHAEALRIHSGLSGQVLLHSGTTFKISLSIGAAELAPGETLKDLQARANRNLLLAKKSGKNKVACKGQIVGPK